MKLVLSILLYVCMCATAPAQGQNSLQECIALAPRHHPALQARAAQARIRRAASTYLRKLDATYSANRRSTSVTARAGATLGTTTETFNSFDTGLSFSQPLSDFGQAFYAIESAQSAAKASRADWETPRQQMILRVRQAYFTLLTAQNLRAVAAEAIRRSEKHLELAKARYDVRLATRPDATRERAQLAANQLDPLRGEHNVRLGYVTLRQTLGLDAPGYFALEEIFVLPAILAEEDTLIRRAWENRPKLRRLAARICAAEQALTALERHHLPAIAAGGQEPRSEAAFPLRPNGNTGAAMTLPLFRGGLTVAETEAAKHTVGALGHDTDTFRQRIALEVREARLRLGAAAKSIQVSQEGAKHARQNLALAGGRYASSEGSVLEMTGGPRTFFTAKTRESQALYNHHRAAVALERAIGAALARPSVSSVQWE